MATPPSWPSSSLFAPSGSTQQIRQCITTDKQRDDRVQCAIQYATNAANEYRWAQNEYSTVPGALETVLIPVGGAAVALGIEGYTGAPITGLGVGTASLLGMGTLYQNKDREKIYGAGADAVTCLLSNMSPFTDFGTVYSGGNGTQSLDSDLQRLSEVLCGGRHGGLNAKVAKLELETALYNSLQIYKDCSPSRSQSERQQAAALVKAAHTADKAGQAALKAGQNFLDTANKAPATIVDTVDKINGAINSALIATEPDVQSLASNLKGVIPDSATGLAGIKSTAAATTTTTTAAAQEVGISEAFLRRRFRSQHPSRRRRPPFATL